MRPRLVVRLLQILSLFTVASGLAVASVCAVASASAESHLSIVVSVPEQRLYVFNPEGDEICHYAVSTSKYGVGDSCGSYNTPLGRMEVASKCGSGAVTGTVFKSLARTGEIVAVNARGRDPIVTRIMWLRGREAQNSSAYSRHIYIHGTPDEAHIGRPASYGCIRMRSKDIIALYETADVGTSVEITNTRVGSMFSKARWTPMPSIAAAPVKPKAKPASEAAPATVVASVPDSSKPMAKTVASADVAVAPAGRSKALSLSEPLIGAPDSPEPKAKKKSVVTVSGRKSRS